MTRRQLTVFLGLRSLFIASFFVVAVITSGSARLQSLGFGLCSIPLVVSQLVGKDIVKRRYLDVYVYIFAYPGAFLLLVSSWTDESTVQFRSFIFRLASEGGTPTRLCLTAALIIVAILLFLLKKHDLFYYAGLEIVFGVASCYEAIARVNKYVNQYLALTGVIGGSVYLLVRGFQNLDDARLKRSVHRAIKS